MQQSQPHQLGAHHQQPQPHQLGAHHQQAQVNQQVPVETWSVFEQRARETMHRLSTQGTISSLAVENNQDQHVAAAPTTTWEHRIEVSTLAVEK